MTEQFSDRGKKTEVEDHNGINGSICKLNIYIYIYIYIQIYQWMS